MHYLQGSRARGDAKDESDWDILILIDKPKLNRTIEEKYRDETFQLQLELRGYLNIYLFQTRLGNKIHLYSFIYKYQRGRA